jgi:oxygen-independent coproporphyrinogen-3 oxidase
MIDANEALRALARKYVRPGPRYTSYPTAADFGPLRAADYEHHLAHARKAHAEPWSVYVHVPFCAKRCDFCACSVIATPDHDRVAEPYVEHLLGEIGLVSRHLGSRRRLAQLHLGGGTPTYLTADQLSRVFAAISKEFVRDPLGEWSIELDARATRDAHVDLLGEFGFGRVSLGIQDLDPQVQAHIGRIQSRARIVEVIQRCRERGVEGVNLDLIYGLPGQSLASMSRTLDGVLELEPDRLALYGYAHMPWVPGRGNQRRIDESLLPGPSARLDMFLAAREQLLRAGYEAIGMDHFARPTDDLARAAKAGTLTRNFMGYTVRGGTDLLGFGVTAIGEIGEAIVQNSAKLSRWSAAIEAGELPTARGIVRTPEDQLHAAVIGDLMCHHTVDKRAIEARFRLPSFDETFAFEIEQLQGAVFDGLVFDEPDSLSLSETGKLFVRNVAMAFDARLRAKSNISSRATPRFSATV